MNQPDIHDCVIDIEDVSHMRPLAGNPKPRRETRLSEQESVVAEALFTAPPRDAFLATDIPVTGVKGLTAKEIAIIIEKPAGTIRPLLSKMAAKGTVRRSAIYVIVAKRKEAIWEAQL